MARSDYFTDYFIANPMLLKLKDFVKYFLAAVREVRVDQSGNGVFDKRYWEKLTTFESRNLLSSDNRKGLPCPGTHCFSS